MSPPPRALPRGKIRHRHDLARLAGRFAPETKAERETRNGKVRRVVVISTRVVNGRRITVHDASYAPASQCSSGRKIASRGKGIPWDFLHQRPY